VVAEFEVSVAELREAIGIDDEVAVAELSETIGICYACVKHIAYLIV
jgi:hypothetical protein